MNLVPMIVSLRNAIKRPPPEFVEPSGSWIGVLLFLLGVVIGLILILHWGGEISFGTTVH
jgi:hypothetical protein